MSAASTDGGLALPATMIVTGYNQADLISDAIEGAFRQDYPNLQIILTDDASTDGTYDKMVAAAQAYQGPHRVIATRLHKNRGTLGNLYHGAQHATGELLIFAGGDDISYPHRVSRLVDFWVRTQSDAFYSKYDLVDAKGHLIERGFTPNSDKLALRDYFKGKEIDAMHGASGACHRSVFDRYPLPPVRIRSEDTFFTLMFAMDGKPIRFVDEALVAYRKHAGAITNEVAPEARSAAVRLREEVQMSFAASQRDLLEFYALEREKRGLRPVFSSELHDDLLLLELRARWLSSSLSERLRVIPAAIRRHQLDWLLPRLMGSELFVRLKASALRMRRP